MITNSIIIENYNKITVEGVKDVESFSPDDIIIITNGGALKIKGNNLEIVNADTETAGVIILTGDIISMHFSDSYRGPNNIITKLFR